MSEIKDEFDGDNDLLVASASALLDMDARGAVYPPLVGHARTIISAFVCRIARGEARTGQASQENSTLAASISVISAAAINPGKGSGMTPEIVKLRFDNRNAYGEEGRSEVIELQVRRSDVKHIMAWYGAYCAGDDYDVFINGRRQSKDQNGEFEPVTITV